MVGVACDPLLQEFGFSELGEIQFEEDLCLDVSSSQVGGRIHIYSCHGFGGNQKWLYNNSVSALYWDHACLGIKCVLVGSCVSYTIMFVM